MGTSNLNGLRVLLYALSAIDALAGIALLFATSLVLSTSPKLFALSNAGFVVAVVKGVGILVIAFAYLLCVAARDPVRYVSVIDTLIFILLAAAALNLYAIAGLHIGSVYPSAYLIVRAGFQILLAAGIFALRPRGITRTS